MYMVGANKVLYVSEDPDGFFRPLIRGAAPGYGVNTSFEIFKIAVRVPDQGKVELWGLGADVSADILGIYKIETGNNKAAGIAELVYQLPRDTNINLFYPQFIDGDTLSLNYPSPYGRYNVQTRQFQEAARDLAGENSPSSNRDPRGDGIHIFIHHN